MFAALIEGKTDLADWLFLAALVAAVISTILFVVTPPHRLASGFLAAAVALAAAGWLVL